MTEGQRFTVRYALSMRNAAIEFLHDEGPASGGVIRHGRHRFIYIFNLLENIKGRHESLFRRQPSQACL